MKTGLVIDKLTNERRAAFGRSLYRNVRIPDGVGKRNILEQIAR